MSISEIPFASLISGGGSTMEALGRACQNGGPLYGKARLVTVIASTPDTPGLEKANALGIDLRAVINPKDYQTPEAFGEAIIRHLNAFSIWLVFQNGWMPLTPPNVIGAFPGRIYNQHPGPLDPGHRDVDGKQLDFGGPGMYGLRVHAAVLEFARTCGRTFPFTEATAQYVAPDFDAGTVIGRRSVPIEATDDPYTLAKRVLPAEHELQINIVLDFANGTVQPQIRHPILRRDEDIKLWQEKTVARRLFPNG